MQTKQEKQIKFFSGFKSLWKTKSALQILLTEPDSTLNKRQSILSYYWTKVPGKSKGKINRRDIADRVYSEYIRLFESDDKGMVTCPCCGVKIHWTIAHAMHYRSRDCLKYRFDDMNVHAGCMRCNVILSGNYREYHIFMVKMYGEFEENRLWTDKGLVDLNQYWYMEKIMEWYDKILRNKKRLGMK